MHLKLSLAVLLGISAVAYAQEEKSFALIKGRLFNQTTSEPANDIQVTIPRLRMLTTSDDTGAFSFRQVRYGTYNLVFHSNELTYDTIRIIVDTAVVDLGPINIACDDQINAIRNALIPTLSLDENNIIGDDDGIAAQNVSGLLTASRDPYQNTVAFIFGPYRFQPRGYDRSAQQIFINGAPMNDVETGDVFWSQWGGLNDVFRSRNSAYGLEASEFAIGGINGAVYFDATAASQRPQTRITYSNSNRQFRNRLMITHSSGLLRKGWAFCTSFSRRWAKESYTPGTFYDAYSYYAAATKRFGVKHDLNLITFGAPTRRGKTSPVVQQVYDLTGSAYYNPNWGYQNGEKRNARVVDYHQPTFILSYQFSPDQNTHWHTSVSYQFGKNANSMLDWYNGADPRPDYYRYLPSWRYELYQNNPELAAQEADDVKRRWGTDINVQQINWDKLYQVNLSNFETINNINGIADSSFYGRRSVYVVGSFVDDIRKYTFNTYLQHKADEHIILYEGVTALNQITERYKRLEDLLGGDYYVNYNQFAERQYIANSSIRQNDLDNPNRIIHVGDEYGYHYKYYFLKTWAWIQAAFSYNKIDFFVGASGGVSSFRREGLYRNGLYPDNSLGYSPGQKFIIYMLKGGMTYKINGRNYLFLNMASIQDAPTADNTFISPATRNQTIENPSEQNTYAAEGGYLLRAPKLNGRMTGYVTEVKGTTEIKRFYNEAHQSFTNYVLQNIDKRFTGVEIALDYKLKPSWNVTVVASLNQAFYTNRPTGRIYGDNDTSMAAAPELVYLNNYYLSVGPQSSYALGLKYSSKRYWFANLTISHFDRNFVDVAAVRHTANAVASLTPGTPEWHKVLDQEQLPSFITVDLFLYKSLRLSGIFKFLPKNTFLYLSLGVNNLLNNQHIRTGGFEQLRYDSSRPDKFPSKYFYAYGRSYFANFCFRF